MNGYVAFFKNKRWDCFADSLYAAKLLACDHFKVHPKRAYSVSVMLAVKDGVPVVHDGAVL